MAYALTKNEQLEATRDLYNQCSLIMSRISEMIPDNKKAAIRKPVLCWISDFIANYCKNEDCLIELEGRIDSSSHIEGHKVMINWLKDLCIGCHQFKEEHWCSLPGEIRQRYNAHLNKFDHSTIGVIYGNRETPC